MQNGEHYPLSSYCIEDEKKSVICPAATTWIPNKIRTCCTYPCRRYTHWLGLATHSNDFSAPSPHQPVHQNLTNSMDTPAKKYMELTITNERFYFYLFSLGWLRESDRFFALPLPLPLHSAIKTILFALSKINAYKRLQCKHCSRDVKHTFFVVLSNWLPNSNKLPHNRQLCTEFVWWLFFCSKFFLFKFFLGEFGTIKFLLFSLLSLIV